MEELVMKKLINFRCVGGWCVGDCGYVDGFKFNASWSLSSYS